MNRSLEDLLLAYDAAQLAGAKNLSAARARYEALLEDELTRHSHIKRDDMESAILLQYHRWLRQQTRRPSAMPPTA